MSRGWVPKGKFLYRLEDGSVIDAAECAVLRNYSGYEAFMDGAFVPVTRLEPRLRWLDEEALYYGY